MSDTIAHISDYIKYLEYITTKSCVIKFTADWCGPCKKIAPLFSNFASLHKDSIKFIEVDIDTSDKITNHEDVKSIPLFLFYHDGYLLDDISLRGASDSGLKTNMAAFLAYIESNPPTPIEKVVVPGEIVEEHEQELDDGYSSSSSSSCSCSDVSGEYGDDCDFIEKTLVNNT